MFDPTVQRLVDSFRTGATPPSSAHDYRQAGIDDKQFVHDSLYF